MRVLFVENLSWVMFTHGGLSIGMFGTMYFMDDETSQTIKVNERKFIFQYSVEKFQGTVKVPNLTYFKMKISYSIIVTLRKHTYHHTKR